MGLRAKLLSGFLILAIMLLIAGLWSIHELNNMGGFVQKILDENYKSIQASKLMIEALEREDSAILLLLLGKWDEGRMILKAADSIFTTNFQIAYNNITISGEQTHIDTIRSKYNSFKKIWERPIVGTGKEGNLNWYFKDVHKSFLSAKNAINNLIDLNNTTMYQTASKLKSRSNRAIMPGIVAIISALFFTIIFNYLVNYYMTGPIIRITDGIKQFMDKKIPFDVDVETKDEIFDLVNSIKDLCTIVSLKENQ